MFLDRQRLHPQETCATKQPQQDIESSKTLAWCKIWNWVCACEALQFLTNSQTGAESQYLGGLSKISSSESRGFRRPSAELPRTVEF